MSDSGPPLRLPAKQEPTDVPREQHGRNPRRSGWGGRQRRGNECAASVTARVRFAKFHRSRTMNWTPHRKAVRVSGSKERQRRLARERIERQQQRRIERSHKIRQRTAIAGSAVAVVAIAVGAYFLFGVSSSKPSASATSKPTASTSPTPSPSKPVLPPASPLATVPKG